MSEEQHKAPPAGLVGTVDHIDAGGGWLVVRLLTRQAMLREGMHMDHCLGDGGYYDLTGDEDMTSDAIWSLRDPHGVSWATLDIRAGTGGRRHVIMAHGPGNRTVRKAAARRLTALVAAFRAAGVPLDFSGETKLVMADDGRVMRAESAPAEVIDQVRARHGERIAEAGRDRLPECAARVSMRAISPSEYVANILGRTGPLAFIERARAIVGSVGAGLLGAAAAVENARSDDRTMTAHDLKAGQWFDLDATRVTDVAVSAGGIALRHADDFEVDAAGGIVKFNRDVPGELVITFRAGIRPQRRLLTVEEWCAQHLTFVGGGASGAGPGGGAQGNPPG